MSDNGDTPIGLLYRLRALARERVVLRGVGLVLGEMALLGAIYGYFPTVIPLGIAVAVTVGLLSLSLHWWLVLSWVQAWDAANDLVSHAKLIERTRSAMHGRLILLAEHQLGRHPTLSRERLSRLQTRVRRELRQRPLSSSEIPRASRHWALLALLLLSGWWGWEHVTDASHWVQLKGSDTGEEGVDATQAAVGDLVLEYQYPDYTGLPPMIVANSTGEAHGVPGTRVTVTAKVADSLQEAQMHLDARPAERAEVLSGNRMRGAFMIDDGQEAYWFSMYNGSTSQESPRYPIAVEQDLPPVVSLTTGDDALTIGLTEPIGAVWKVDDDYGVLRVRWRVDGVDGRRDLLSSGASSTSVTGELSIRPMDLGLSVGDRAKLQIIAWDNNDVAGSQRGESEDLLIIVGGEEGASKHARERQVALRDAIIPLLSQHLLQAWPPAKDQRGVARWGEKLFTQMQPLEQIYDDYKSWGVVGLERRLLDDIATALRSLVQRTQAGGVPVAKGVLGTAPLLELKADHEMLILVEEDALYLLDRAIRAVAIDETLTVAKRMIRLSARVQRAAAAEATPGQVATILSAVERVVSEGTTAHNQLDPGALQSMAVRGGEQALRLVEAIRSANALDDAERSAALVDRLSTSLRDTGVGVSDMIEAMRSQENELQSEAEGLVEALEALESDQRDLLDVVYAIRKKQEDNLLPQMNVLWEQVLTAVYETATQAEQYSQGLKRHRRSFSEQTQADEVVQILDRLETAVRARDIRGARRAVELATDTWGTVEVLARFALEQRQGTTGPKLSDVVEVGRNLSEVYALLARLEKLAEEADPVAKMKTKKLAPQESQLGSTLSEVQRAAAELAVKLPVPPRGMLAHLELAASEMSRAEAAAALGLPMPAQGSMGAAAQQISDALDALLEAMAAGSSGKGAASDGGNSTGKDPAPFDMEIPGPEEFLSAEAYRAALLKGLATEAPAAYEATKNKYFEELVIQ
jgi:hypothetical protein